MPAALIGLASADCLGTGAFECSSDNECFLSGEFGACVEPGYCAFDDDACESGQRYGDHAASLGGVCVPPEDAEGSASAGETSTDDTGTTGEGTDTTGSTTDPDTGETTGVPECATPADCPSDCFSCESEKCVPDIGAQASCGECAACNANGDCDPTIVQGQSCTSGSTIDCKNYVWGEGDDAGDWSCYAYADVQVTGSCDGLGACQLPTPEDCPNMVGEALHTCDLKCAKQDNPCTQGALAAKVSFAAFCYVNQASPLCKQSCSDGTGSSETHRVCNGAAQCTNTQYVDCGSYRCDGDSCGTSCQNDADCVWFHTCVDNECVAN